MTPDAEPRYSPTELFAIYREFMNDKAQREQMNRDDIRWWQDTELTLRFLAYVAQTQQACHQGQ